MPLVLFDIDGTLLLTSGAGRRAIVAALGEEVGQVAGFDRVRFDGKTDPQIVAELLEAAGQPEPRESPRVHALCQRYVSLLAEELKRTTTRTTLMPGVASLLDHLEREKGVVLGLLTGNLEAGAALKLRSGGIDPLRFRVGAFGSDSAHRPDLPAIAARRAEPFFGRRPTGSEVVIIGDTPADVACGSGIAARAVAVATGSYSTADLAACAPTRRVRGSLGHGESSGGDSRVRAVLDELELKAVVADPDALRTRLLAAGAVLEFQGRMSDRRFDRDGELSGKDEVLRLRSLHRPGSEPGRILGWKGPVRRTAEGYKERAEIEVPLAGGAMMAETLLGALGYRVIHAMDRDVEIYRLGSAVLRLEVFPRMDVLLEVEGNPIGIEQAIAVSGIPRDAFSPDSLTEFVRRYETRAGVPALLAEP